MTCLRSSRILVPPCTIDREQVSGQTTIRRVTQGYEHPEVLFIGELSLKISYTCGTVIAEFKIVFIFGKGREWWTEGKG